MQVVVNGQPIELPEGTFLPELLERLNLDHARCAIAINREVVPRSEIVATRLQPGDQVELVHAVGGG